MANNECCRKSTNQQNEPAEDIRTNFEEFYSERSNKRRPNYISNMGDKIVYTEGKVYKFSHGNPNPLIFPYERVEVTLKDGVTFEIKDKELQDSLSYLTCRGHKPLISILKDFQDKLHGKQPWTHKDITTTSGCLGGLFQMMDVLITNGEPVLMEAPVYPGYIPMLHPLDVEALEVESDEKGLSSTYMRKLLNDRKAKNLKMPKILYTNPTGTNPTGIIVPTDRKKEIYQLACEFDFLIFEDDPYYLLSFQKEHPVSYLTLDTENRVIRFDTFSKTIGAGFRLGYVTAPKQIIARLDSVKESTAIASPFCQFVVYNTLSSWGIEGFLRHIEYVKGIYSEKRDFMLEALDKHLKNETDWVIPDGAQFVWLKIKNVEHVSQEFVDKCVSKNIFLLPGFAFYPKQRLSPHIRLGFSMVSEDEIKTGVKMLADLIKEGLAKKQKHL